MTYRSSHLIVGSGASGVMAALALSRRADQLVTIIDVGARLEPHLQQTVTRMSNQSEGAWAPEDLALVSTSPVAATKGSLPQKRTYGSAFPFRDHGQTTGISGPPGANLDIVSAAYGGFTNVWGAQLMPFSPSTLRRWPVTWGEMEPHYRAVLDEVPLAADEDDLAELFPILNRRSGLPPLAPRTSVVLERYARHRHELRRRGMTLGRARLAFQARDCVRCGLCMTGCPYGLIYSASQTLDKLRKLANVRYLDRMLVERVGQVGEEAFAQCQDLRTGERHEFRADRLFLGAGGIGSARLMLGSLPEPPAQIDVAESVQFLVPFLSARPVEDPRREGAQDFSLNQFNILLQFDDEGHDVSQVHCYPYNPAFFDALPAPLRWRAADGLATQVLRRLTVGLGYLPSWASPRMRLNYQPGPAGRLPDLSLSWVDSESRPAMLGKVIRNLHRAAPRLDLWPVIHRIKLTGPGKSYHFGSSFPHRQHLSKEPGVTGTDRLGRVPDWDRVHLIDGSVLPTVPSTTFTLTVMTNAHRIATEVLETGLTADRGADATRHRSG
ncbi:MAG TPA: hypothetical protein VEQ66_12420 [Propionibacteriaceae bacterium]|nr:hypothetical protein [Propionibacteriaceae bacterium]